MSASVQPSTCVACENPAEQPPLCRSCRDEKRDALAAVGPSGAIVWSPGRFDVVRMRDRLRLADGTVWP